MKGLKLRTPHEIQLQAAMEALGATVQAIAFPELYQALSQKTVDGQENPIAVIYANKFYEVQKHLAITRHVFNNMIHTASAVTWNKLSSGQQGIFREESISAGNLMRKLIAESDQINKLEAHGLEITRPKREPFRARMAPAYRRIAAYVGEDKVNKFLDLHLMVP
jgi:TRAP-type transport system periplasmic protein